MPIGNRFKLVTVRGIPIYVATSWIWIALIWGFAIYTNLQPAVSSPARAVWLTIFEGALFFGGVLLHEAAHAIAARGYGLPVAGITLVFWGGATETASSAKGPRAEFVIAFVGPATTLVLAAAFWFAARAVDIGLTRDILHELAWLNLFIGLANALPGFPLDGGRMLLAATWAITKNRRTAVLVAGYGAVVVGAALIGAAILTFRSTTGLWLFFGYLGFVMLTTGRGTPQRVKARDILARGTAADAMRPPPTEQIPASISLSEASVRWLRDAPDRTFPVTEAGRVVGTVSLDSARKVGGRDPLRPVRDGMTPLSQTTVVAPTDRLDDVVEWMGGHDALVLSKGSLVGAIAPADVERWFQKRFVDPIGEQVDPGSMRPDPTEVPPRPDLDRGVGEAR